MRKLLLSTFGLSLLVTLALLVIPSVFAEDQPACLPILGVTSAVDVQVEGDASRNVSNTGVIFFDEGIQIPELNYVTSVPYPEYRACVIDKGAQASDNSVRYVLEGWALDSNLGWISFNCKNGKNRGQLCSESGVDYQVEITQGGVIQGFAYSDIAGWIGWSCRNGKNLMSGSAYNCGAVNYSNLVYTSASPEIAPGSLYQGKMYYPLRSNASMNHSWSDSFGWFKNLGMKLPFGDFVNDSSQCSNGIDDDGDGKKDFPEDSGCSSTNDNEEVDTQCSNGLDDDGDGRKDFPEDPGCDSYEDLTEDPNPSLLFQCSDGIDNDGDGIADYPDDPGCYSANDNDETDIECSNGIDDDGDGTVDYLGVDKNGDGDFTDPGEFEPDFGCSSPDDVDESLDDPPQCSDGVDNDGDGNIDFPLDSQCSSLSDDDESGVSSCADLQDNDGDNKIDFMGVDKNGDGDTNDLDEYDADPGCKSYEDNDEIDKPLKSQCSDGIDNDGDGIADGKDLNGNGKIDVSELEPGCHSLADNDETDKQCNDKKDNDGDGYVDYPDDPGCVSPSDDKELEPECMDGVDNDGDNKVDFNGLWDGAVQILPKDPQCTNKLVEAESGCPDPAKQSGDLNCIEPGSAGMSLSIKPNPYTNPLVADGVSVYTIEMNLADSAGNPYDTTYTFDGKAKPTLEDFMEVSLFEKQYYANGEVQSKFSFSDLKSNGLVTDFAYKAAKKKWVAYVASPVPTAGVPGVKFLITPKSLDPADSKLALDENSLVLKKVVFNEIKKGGEIQPGSCYLAKAGESCGLVADETKSKFPGQDDTVVPFKPIASFKKLLADGKNYLQAVSGVENDVEFEVEYNGDPSLVAKPKFIKQSDIDTHMISSAYEAKVGDDPLTHTFVYNWTDFFGDPAVDVVNTDVPTNKKDSVYTKALTSLIGAVRHFGVTPLLKASEESNEYVGTPSLVTYFEYAWNDKTINYFAERLPSTEVEGIYNPAADIDGLISSKVVVNPQDEKKLYSTGNLTSNVLRDTVTGNIASILGAKTEFVPLGSEGSPLIVKQQGGNCVVLADGETVSLDVTGGKFYYVRGPKDIVFDSSGGDIDCGKENNIIVTEGGRVFIDANLYSSKSDKGKWSIIALRAGAGVGQQGGNIYVDTEVTNVNANILADGSLIGYKKSSGREDFDSDGYPNTKLTDEDNKKQFALVGSISSWNTIGGSLDNKHKKTNGDFAYVLPNGRFTDDQERARLGDLNYFRAFKLYLERCNVPGLPSFQAVIDQQCKDEGESAAAQCAVLPAKPACSYDIDTTKSAANGGDLIDYSKNDLGNKVELRAKGTTSDNPVYIKFDPPAANNAAFKSNKSLSSELKNF